MTQVAPVDSLLVLDVGNTRIGMAVWDADGLHDARRVRLDAPDDWPDALSAVWSATRAADRRGVVLASVAPSQTRRVLDAAARATECEAVRVRDDIPLPMPLGVENAGEVGVDRVCSASAAFERVQEACVVASFGTAITIDCVSADGRFLGGTIMPGLRMACEALHEFTDALPLVEPGPPRAACGTNTREAILSGVVFGAVGGLREIVERFATDLGQWPQLILTGGDAPLIREHADFVDAVVPDLCLMGVALAYRRAAGQP